MRKVIVIGEEGGVPFLCPHFMMISPIMTAATIPKVAAVMAKVRISSYPELAESLSDGCCCTVPAAIAAWHSDAEGRVQGPYPVQDKQSQQSSKSPLQQHSCL